MPFLDNQTADVTPVVHNKVTLNPFQKLVQDLSDVLGPSSGIDSDDVDPMELQKLMEEYTSNPEEWYQYALADPSRAYTRNLVDEGNGKSNLVSDSLLSQASNRFSLTCSQLVLVWSPGKSSPIHDHANAHCVMKVRRDIITAAPCSHNS